jgi:hypothetical protein
VGEVRRLDCNRDAKQSRSEIFKIHCVTFSHESTVYLQIFPQVEQLLSGASNPDHTAYMLFYRCTSAPTSAVGGSRGAVVPVEILMEAKKIEDAAVHL